MAKLGARLDKLERQSIDGPAYRVLSLADFERRDELDLPACKIYTDLASPDDWPKAVGDED